MPRMIMRMGVATVLAAAVTALAPLPAMACACGGFVGTETIRVGQETAVVQLAGNRETVTMSFAAQTTAKQAAFVMPVPARAGFELGDQAMFGELDKLTAPEIRTVEVPSRGDDKGGAAATAPGEGSGVTVTDHVTIGPYEVAQLGGSDPAELATWLSQHGFTLPPKLSGGLAPYLAEGWQVVAVRIAATGAGLQGALPPFRLAFDTGTPVYPMRLSALAANRQALRLYVLAEHRIDATSPAPRGTTFELAFAGRTDSARYPHVPGAFVTRYDGSWDPSQISADVKLTTAAEDTGYRKVITRYVTVAAPVPDGKSLSAAVVVAIVLAGLVTLSLVVLAVWLLAHRARR